MATESTSKVVMLSLVAPTTLLFMCANIVVYILQLICGWTGLGAAMWPDAVIHHLQIYRVFTSHFFHANVLHIVLDCVALWYLSARVERQVGTISHFMGTIMAMIFKSGFFLLIAWALDILFGYDKCMNSKAIGFGGILFYYLVLDCFALFEGPVQRRIFGIVTVPVYLAPFAMLVVAIVLIPNSSILGGVAGLLTGFIKFFGLMPFTTLGPAWDDWACFAVLKRWPGFVPAPNPDDKDNSQADETTNTSRSDGNSNNDEENPDAPKMQQASIEVTGSNVV